MSKRFTDGQTGGRADVRPACPSYTTIGSFRIRCPVAAKIALTTAGAIGGVPGSPTPPGASVRLTVGADADGLAEKPPRVPELGGPRRFLLPPRSPGPSGAD